MNLVNIEQKKLELLIKLREIYSWAVGKDWSFESFINSGSEFNPDIPFYATWHCEWLSCFVVFYMEGKLDEAKEFLKKGMTYLPVFGCDDLLNFGIAWLIVDDLKMARKSIEKDLRNLPNLIKIGQELEIGNIGVLEEEYQKISPIEPPWYERLLELQKIRMISPGGWNCRY